ncbi:MAG: DUF1592 domain-containing protein [Verrucomicrobiales bacterium]|nr:DUF1592 domain-containing protein [Verrucomicrobiales bacterium]
MRSVFRFRRPGAIAGLILSAACLPGRAEIDSFSHTVQPLVEKHCVECHRGAKAKGGVNLTGFTNTASLYRDPRLWENVVRQVEERTMPPKDEEQPSEAERLHLRDTLTALLDNPDPQLLPRDPGARVLHRLNRTEYNNTVRDLLGVTTRPADRFPADGGGGGGFDNNADTLFVPPILMEKYLAAAEDILVAAPPDRLWISQPAWFRSDRETAARNLAWFARRAFRRPVDPGEVDRLLGIYQSARREGTGFHDAVLTAYKAVLVSPHFLFRIERERPGGKPWRLDGFELASRLSYFLWSAPPDEALLAAAENGSLSEPAVYEAQVRRMLRDPRIQALAESFTSQWLGTKTLQTTAQPDRNRFPIFTDSLRDAMAAEPVEFFASLVRDNGSVLSLLDADYTFANAELARLYGITNLTATNLVRVTLPDRNRGGIVGMAAVLTQTSYPLRTSPVLRGKWILEEVLGTPPPPPPPLVATLPPDDRVTEGQTFRQRLEAHRKNPNCAACHSRLDPLGFALENFDPVGRWRTEVDGRPVDAAGTLSNGDSVAGPAQLKEALLVRKQLFVRHLTEKLLSYALGRGLEYYDIPSVKSIVRQVEADSYRMDSLILEIVRSYPFLWRRGESTPTTASTGENSSGPTLSALPVRVSGGIVSQ